MFVVFGCHFFKIGDRFFSKMDSIPSLKDVKICRICLDSATTMKYSNKRCHFDVFTHIVGFERRDADFMPFWLCIYCAASIDRIIILRNRSITSNEILREFYKNSDKNRLKQADLMHIEANRTSCNFNQLTVSHFNTPTLEIDEEQQLNDEIKVEKNEELEHSYEDDKDASLYSDDSDSKPLAFVSSFMKNISEEKRTKKERTGRKRKKSKIVDSDHPTNNANHREELDDLLRNVRIVTDKYTITRLTREEVVLDIADRYAKSTAIYKCEQCGRGFKYEDVYAKHMNKHEKKPDYLECDLCHQFFSSTILMRIHTKGHYLKYRCNACKKVCGSAFLLKEHYFQKHESEHKSLTCHVCGKIMMRMSSLTTHLKKHTDASIVSCDTCGETFKSMDTLRSHRLSLHSEERPYKCSECPKAFRYSGALSTHKQTHRKTRDYYCVECDIAFKTWHCLKVHLEKTNRHATADTLKHACSECDKRFGCARLLKHHISWHHQGKKLHPCPHCPKSYGSYEGLRKHVKVIHEGVLGEFKYICEYCAKPFRVKAVWRSHVRIHTGERPYSCETCGRRFTQKIAMDTHVRLVHLKLKRNVKKKGTDAQVLEQPS